MKLSNKYDLTSTFNINGKIFGKAINILKNIFTNSTDKDSVSGNCIIDCRLSGEMSLDLSVEEMIELHKEYGEDFEKTIKYLKEELRPCVKEFMLAIDDATAAIQKTIYDAENRKRIHDEKVVEEREAAEAAKEKKSKKSE